jgi:glycosyltransferase involved in cell wall biosynthesis
VETISLCIPALNAAWSLHRLNNSLINQNIKFHEILLYDDCSTDNTVAIANELGFKVIRGSKNMGCSHGKNELAKVAESEWLFFLDSDDILLPEFSESAQKAISNSGNEVDMILLAYEYIDAISGKNIGEVFYDTNLLERDPILFMINTKVVNSSLVKRQRFLDIGGFDTDSSILYVEDRAYAIKTALNGFRYCFIAKPCFRIYYHNQSMSTKKPENWLNATIDLWDKINRQTNGKYKKYISRQLYENAVWATKHNEWKILNKSLLLANKIDNQVFPDGSKYFIFIFNIWPYGAYYIREYLLRFIQYFK